MFPVLGPSRCPSWRANLARMKRTALVVACVSAVFLSEQYYAPFWLLGALATALWREGEREPEPEAA